MFSDGALVRRHHVVCYVMLFLDLEFQSCRLIGLLAI